MQEKIGNITLDYTYYPGEDLYSDGEVEDRLLQIAMEEKEDYNSVIAREKSWPVMYHFSHVRQNSVHWLPITKEDHVLEIGSGCGAVTGILAEKAGSVRCIELSKKRSYINAHRNQKYENIRIDVGNFADIEAHLTESFDYITLIGVFEYSKGYIGGSEPYVEMLRKITRHLKPGGKIVIAIENRLGLKYWAGCTEDHVGQFFEGLEGYEHTEGVRTFSKGELEEMIARAGTYETEFYYPYPDYKFPMAVYSDERQPLEGELKTNIQNFDRKRLVLFDETKVFDSMAKSGLFPEFSNSFLAILTVPEEEKKEQKRERMIYSKYSNERCRRYAIRTDILKKADGQKIVRKVPWCQEGKSHVEKILRHYETLSRQYEDSIFRMNRCKAAENGVELEYLDGETLEEQMDRLLHEQREQEAKELMLSYLDAVRTAGSRERFKKTEAFREVFGDPDLPEGLESWPVTDIDLVLANVVIKNGWNVLDYEWTFDFPVPIDYVLFRIIHYYVETKASRQCVRSWNLYQEMGISQMEIQQYLLMERRFQQYIQGQYVPLRELYEEISPGILDEMQMVSRELKRQMEQRLQVFFAVESDFEEKSSVYYPMKEGQIQISLDLPKNVKKIRLDPCSCPGVLTIEKLQFEGAKSSQVSFLTNGKTDGEGHVVFATADPQLIISKIPEDAQTLFVKLQMDPELERIAGCWERERQLWAEERQQLLKQQELERERLRAQIVMLQEKVAGKEHLIREMESTKVWRAYRKVKGITGKGK